MMRLMQAWLLPVALATGSMLASADGFRSISDIEAALDPLEFVADYDGVRVSIDLTIHFDFDSARIKPESQAQLDALGNALMGERLGEYQFRIVGHTDGVGGTAYNQRLSERRANAVIAALVEHHGVDPARLSAVGKGFSEPRPGLASTHAEHRRVEVQTILAPREEAAGSDRLDDLDGINVGGDDRRS